MKEFDAPVYVGKAQNFLHRLAGHRSTKPQPHWGWNALLKLICAKRLNVVGYPTEEDLMVALPIMDEFGVVRVQLDRQGAKQKLSRLESAIMQGTRYQSDTLLNGATKRWQDNRMAQLLENLM